jgi:hypothetical protein
MNDTHCPHCEDLVGCACATMDLERIDSENERRRLLNRFAQIEDNLRSVVSILKELPDVGSRAVRDRRAAAVRQYLTPLGDPVGCCSAPGARYLAPVVVGEPWDVDHVYCGRHYLAEFGVGPTSSHAVRPDSPRRGVAPVTDRRLLERVGHS